MATTTTNTFEGGTSGTTITSGNSGGTSGTAYTVTVTGAPTIEFSNVQAMHGALCAHYVGSSGNTGYLRREHTSTEMYFARRLYFQWKTTVTNSVTFVQLRDSAGTPAVKFQVLTNGSGKVQLSDAGGTNLIFSTVTLVADRWYRLEVQGLVGTTTTNGILNGQLYGGTTTKSDADGTTALQSVSSSTANLGTVTPGHWRIFGASTGDLYIDSDTLTTDSATVAPLGAYVPAGNTAPVVTAGATQNLVAGTTTATLTATVTDDTAATTATWALRTTTATSTPTVGSTTATPALPSASTTVTASVTGLAAGQHIFDLTVGDGTLTTVGTTIVNVTSTAPALKAVTAPAFTVVGGGTALAAMQAGTPTTRYLESAAPPGSAPLEQFFQPLQAASVPTIFGVPLRAKDAVTPVTAYVYLMMGSTTIATRGPFTLTTTYATYGGTTTSGEDAAITDRSSLSVKAIGT